MMILPSLYGFFLGFAAIFVCFGVGMLFLRNAASGEVGPGYWANSLFLNSAGFVSWAGTAKYSPWLFFNAGEVLHMLGFITLVLGIYRFTGKKIQRRHIYALCGLVVAWLGTMTFMPQFRTASFFLLMVFRAVLFLWAGGMVLRNIPITLIAGRKLAGAGLLAWGAYVLIFPLIWRLPWLLPMAFGLLVGFHLLATLGMVVLVMDRIRIRAEANEKRVQHLEGLLPICSYCKNIRDDKGYWHQVESYVRDHSEAEFSHSICPECAKKYYPDIDLYGDDENQG
ncbi:MAG: hypothetical protein R6U13_15425 [Desulfatiglandaceae bacterium]